MGLLHCINTSTAAKAFGLGAVVAFWLAACGAASADETTSRSHVDTEAECLSCGVENEPVAMTFKTQPHVAVSPEQLMFFATAGSDELAAETVVVTNNTPQILVLQGVYIADNISLVGAAGGVKFFEIDGELATDTLLPGESVDIDVRFLRSLEQQHALLVLETNREQYESIVVALSGKMIIRPTQSNLGFY